MFITALRRHLWIPFGLLVLLLTACATPYPESCPSYTPFDLSGMEAFPITDSLPFQFPVTGYEPSTPIRESSFVSSGKKNPDSPTEYHAAEDTYHPPGTPVYAMADGTVRFSGPAGGYGWLVIIDHPQANLYSLYGHLSPSRWRIRSGEVQKGELIAHLGDPDENGGSAKNPLVPHLHFGVRTGQRSDYPGIGEWRYMAGWIRYCPQDLGWLQPSVILTSQEIPPGGYPEPKLGLLARWGSELLFTGLYATSGVGMLIFGIRKKQTILMLAPGVLMIAAWATIYRKGIASTYVLVGIGLLVLIFGLYQARISPTGSRAREQL